MSKVIGVHGIWNEFAGPHALKAAWFPHLCDGLHLSGHPPLDEGDFDCVFFGDLYRRTGTKALGAPGAPAPAELAPEEVETLVHWVLEARKEEPTVADPLGAGPNTKARTPRTATWLLQQLSKSRFFMAAGGQPFVLWLLKQVRDYFENSDLRREAVSRVSAAIGPDTDVVVAHSLGSVVVYEALCSLEGRSPALVTIGSPLGIRHLIFDRLVPAPRDGRGVWPKARTWTNIADAGDIVALEKTLAVRFGPDVRDVPVYNGWESHSALRYLTAKETGVAVAAGLKR